MKIDYASDLHFERWAPRTDNLKKWEANTQRFMKRLLKKGNGEVLVLAGDISEWNQQTLWILEASAKCYERVYFTYGNHDLYLSTSSQRTKNGDSIQKRMELIEAARKIPKVVPLFGSVDIFKGKKFAGDAMWYLPKSVEAKQFYRNVMTDSEAVFINGYTMEQVPMVLWKQSMDWYDTLENESIDVFVSHVPPVHAPFSHYPPNECFQTEVPFLASSNWICGHIHLKGEFEKAGTKFHLNCIGYRSEYEGVKKNEIPLEKIDFDLRTFEIS